MTVEVAQVRRRLEVMGADGWVAGLVNAMPAESVKLFELARDGHATDASAPAAGESQRSVTE